MINTRNFIHGKALKFDLPGLWRDYRNIRNAVTSTIRMSKHEYVQGLLKERFGDSSALWSVMKQISSTSSKETDIKLHFDGNDIVEPEMVAEKLNDYFVDSVFELLQTTVNENEEAHNYIEVCLEGITTVPQQLETQMV